MKIVTIYMGAIGGSWVRATFLVAVCVVLVCVVTLRAHELADLPPRGGSHASHRVGVPAQQPSQPKETTAQPPKEWTLEQLLPAVKDFGAGRDWNQGRELFRKAACGVCHAFASESEGTGLAPDLTGAASTFTREFILQSIIEPSATVNGRFMQTRFTLKNGDVITGSVIDEAGKKIVVAPVMMNPQVTIEIAAADVKSEEPSPVSAMPPGLLSGFTREQVIELMAFLDSGGDRNAPVYRKK